MYFEIVSVYYLYETLLGVLGALWCSAHFLYIHNRSYHKFNLWDPAMSTINMWRRSNMSLYILQKHLISLSLPLFLSTRVNKDHSLDFFLTQKRREEHCASSLTLMIMIPREILIFSCVKVTFSVFSIFIYSIWRETTFCKLPITCP